MLMLPMMLPPIAVAITWKLIYEPQFGVLNEIMFQLGLPLQAWAGDANLAMFSIIVADVWQWTPFIFLLMLAGLASLPQEPYEAAAIDGASAWRQFWDLTLPFLKPVIAIALLLRIMDALRLFDLVFILTGGGPADRTKVLSLYIYQVAYRFVDPGYAAAISLFVLFVTVALQHLVHQAHAAGELRWRRRPPPVGDAAAKPDEGNRPSSRSPISRSLVALIVTLFPIYWIAATRSSSTSTSSRCRRSGIRTTRR